MGKFRRQNRDTMKARAKAAREHESRKGGGGGGGDAAWFKLDFGSTELRILPPFSDRGVIIKEVYEHGWLPPTSTRGPSRGKGNARRAICLARSFPERDIECKLCKALDEAEKRHRGAAKGFWPGRKCHLNALVIQHKDPQGSTTLSPDRAERFKPYIIQIPAGIANWIEIQQDVHDMDFADPFEGINIVVTKTRTGSEPKDVDYKASVTPNGKSPVVRDTDAAKAGKSAEDMMDAIAEEMKDLDIIYGWPKDEKLGEIAKSAQILKDFLDNKAGKTPAGASQGGDSGGSWQDGSKAPSDTGADAVTENYNQQTTTKPADTGSGMAPPSSLADAQKTGQPPCFAGGCPHTGSEDEDFKDTKGWQEDYAKCITCAVELNCKQACLEAGLTQG